MKHGDFMWFDLMTSDPKAAATFYGAVVGWGTQASEGAGMDYTLLTIDGQGVGGISPILADQPDHPPAWSTYVAVDDVDAAADEIRRLGGQVFKGPWDVPGVIRMAVAADPQGAGFLIARGLRDEPMPVFPPHTRGSVGWHELVAKDWAEVWPFYEALFGWTKGAPFDMGAMGAYQLFAHGGPPIGGMMTRPPQVPAPYWGLYFNVDAAGAAADRVKAGGGQVLTGPMEVPGGGWTVQCRDPQGAYFAMLSQTA